jgi:hypothetical protein
VLSANLPDELTRAIRDHYEPAGLVLTEGPRREAESAEYAACRFGLNGYQVAFRVARTTPTKLGQFVTIWKRETPDAEIAPLGAADGVAFVVVGVADTRHRGQFIFDRRSLIERGVFSVGGKGGKRAIRVYPPWSQPIAKDAVRTQHWQLRHFLPLDSRDCSAELRRLMVVTGE